MSEATRARGRIRIDIEGRRYIVTLTKLGLSVRERYGRKAHRVTLPDLVAWTRGQLLLKL